jgi:hypothetical protein
MAKGRISWGRLSTLGRRFQTDIALHICRIIDMSATNFITIDDLYRPKSASQAMLSDAFSSTYDGACPHEPKMYTPPFGETKDAAPIIYLISADTSRRYQLGI